MNEAVHVQLAGEDREIRWDMRAKMRNASLDKPVWFTELNTTRGLYVLCALIWASLVDRDHGWAGPEDLADLLDTPEKQQAAMDAVYAMAAECGLTDGSKKNGPTERKPSTNGLGRSSKSDSAEKTPGESPPGNTPHSVVPGPSESGATRSG